MPAAAPQPFQPWSTTTSATWWWGPTSVHVGGGNTANLLDVWKRQGVEQLLQRALARGSVLTGGSAGGICWFEGGTTDSYGPTLRALAEGLGMVRGSFCPHYDSGEQRRPFSMLPCSMVRLPDGYAAWDRAAIRFDAAGGLVEAVDPAIGCPGLEGLCRRRAVVEEELPCRYLRETPFARLFSGW